MIPDSCCVIESQAARRSSPGARLYSGLLRTVDLLVLWQDRATQRRELAAFDDRMLRDIGVDRATAMEEASKPFWRR